MATNSNFYQKQTNDAIRRQDLKPDQFPDLDWNVHNASESLKQVFNLVETQATGAIHWYLNARRWKRRFAQTCRFCAILMVGVAGLLPIFIQMEIFKINDKPVLEPAFATVFLGIAALLVSLDRFFGFSTGWMRYIEAEHEIRKHLQDFQFEWNHHDARMQGNQVLPSHVSERLSLAKSFLAKMNEVVDRETKLWVAEFKDVLKQIDETVKTKMTTEHLGGANVIVINGETTDQGWNLSVDGSPPDSFQGRNAALTGLAPGLRKIRVEGTINGKPQSAEQAVSINAGAVVSVEMILC